MTVFILTHFMALFQPIDGFWRSWALCLEENKHEKGKGLKMKLYKQWLKKRAVWFGAGMYVQSLGTHMQGYNVKIRKKDLGVILRVGL